MGEIDQKMIHLAYDGARRVYVKEVAEIDAVAELVARGMNAASAKIYIKTFEAVREGKIFKRTISAPSFAIYLRRIEEDFGASVAKVAVSALRSHVAYYNSLGRGNLNRVTAICDEAETRLAR